jgi:adenosylcobinamide-phosphate synthase
VRALRRRALGVALGLVLDQVLPEPPTSWHPVAAFGHVMTTVEHALWADSRRAGAAYATTGVVLGALTGRCVGRLPVVLGGCVAGSELRRVATVVERRLLAGDLEGARAALPALVGRDPRDLDASGISAAVIESLAENAVDAVVAPVCWALLGGSTGAAAYRAVNTMDAMVGHRHRRYRRFGTVAARLDDVANWVPARVYAALVMLARPLAAHRVVRTIRRDAPAHPSPNAGVAEAAMAAVLGVELGGPLRYGAQRQQRPCLGQGPRPAPGDIATAIAVSRRVELLLVLGLLTVGPWRGSDPLAQQHPAGCLDRRPRTD